MSMLTDFLGYVWYSIGYLCYGLGWFTLKFVQRCIYPHKSRYDVSCHVMRIVWRRKFFLIDVVSPYDFIGIHDQYTSPEHALKPNVSLYCLTKDQAIFIETPESINIYSSDINPFQYIGQFQQATKVICMPMASFYKLADDIGKPETSVSYIANTGRCGSTILSQALENVPGTLLHAEPDCLTNIGHMRKDRTLSPSEYEQLLVATMNVLCKQQPGVERICFKTRSCASMHINAITKHFPNVKVIFGYRNSLKTVSSFLGLMISETAQSMAMHLIDNDIFSKVVPFFRRRMHFYFCYSLDCEPPRMRPEDMNTVEQFTYAWANGIKWILDYQNEGGEVLPILYEDMVADKIGTCKLVFKELGIDEKYLKEALRAFGEDSQERSPLGRSNINDEKRRTVTLSDRARANRILAKFELPNIGESVVIHCNTK